MIINSIYIDGIQSIHNPLKIDLDPKITRISGRNTAGKSAIVKAMSLFAGIYSRNDIPGLISRKRPNGKESIVALLLEDGTSLWARIGKTSKVEYQRRDVSGDVLRVWDVWDEEIIDILGWQTVEKEKLCLNIKKSKTNLFIDTAPRTNGQIIDYLCEDKDMELRIANLEDMGEKLKAAVKTSKLKVESYQRKFEEEEEINLDAVERLYKRVSNIDYTRRMKENLDFLTNGKKLDIQYGKIKQLEYYLNLLEFLKCKKNLETLEGRIIKINEVVEIMKSYKMVILIYDKILIDKYREKMGSIYEEFKNYKDIKRLKNYSLTRKYGFELNDKNMLVYRHKSDLIQTSECRVAKEYTGLELRKEEIENTTKVLTSTEIEVGKLKPVREIRSIVNSKVLQRKRTRIIVDMENKISSLIVYRKTTEIKNLKLQLEGTKALLEGLYTILEDNNVCPLCQSELDVKNLKEDM